MEMPPVPPGSGNHPIILVVISANDLAASTAFYSGVFGWQMMPMSSDLTAVVTPAGPSVVLRAKIPVGFPGIVPYIGVTDIKAAFDSVVKAGATVERAPWAVPMVGKLARFKDSSGTIYGLTDGIPPGEIPRMPAPLGSGPKPTAGAICSLEMFAKDGNAAAGFFGEQFGWGSLQTMPQYMAFDPGAGIGGIFQSHTPSMPAVAYIYVDDVAAKLAAIDAAGGKRMGEPMKIPGAGSFGYFTDASGTAMGLIGG